MFLLNVGSHRSTWRHIPEDGILQSQFQFSIIYTVTTWWCDYRRGVDWILDLLTQLGTTSTVITALSLIYTLYK
jgi:hypothetical protein